MKLKHIKNELIYLKKKSEKFSSYTHKKNKQKSKFTKYQIHIMNYNNNNIYINVILILSFKFI